MSKYESQVKQIPSPIEAVYAKLSNLENLRPIVENAQNNEQLKQQIEAAGQDPSYLNMLKNVTLTPDSMALDTGMMGVIALNIIEREDPAINEGKGTIKFETQQSPIEANMWIQLLPGEVGTRMKLTLKADLNPMIKMMIGNKLESGIDKFADMLAMIPYA
jgi:carbon monoxide dehydrogenase subunit G